MLPSGQKLTLGLLATITLEVLTSRAYAEYPVLLPFLNASWKSCSVRVYGTACDSASITSLVSNGGLSDLSSVGETEKSRVGGGRHSCCFW
jgi:hypothetical protein